LDTFVNRDNRIDEYDLFPMPPYTGAYKDAYKYLEVVTPLKPLKIVQPEGSSFKVSHSQNFDVYQICFTVSFLSNRSFGCVLFFFVQVNGYQINWYNWEFRWSFSPREGLILYNVGFYDKVTFSLFILFCFSSNVVFYEMFECKMKARIFNNREYCDRFWRVLH
jgi:Cu2+-containing amine oxidase